MGRETGFSWNRVHGDSRDAETTEQLQPLDFRPSRTELGNHPMRRHCQRPSLPATQRQWNQNGGFTGRGALEPWPLGILLVSFKATPTAGSHLQATGHRTPLRVLQPLETPNVPHNSSMIPQPLSCSEEETQQCAVISQEPQSIRHGKGRGGRQGRRGHSPQAARKCRALGCCARVRRPWIQPLRTAGAVQAAPPRGPTSPKSMGSSSPCWEAEKEVGT